MAESLLALRNILVRHGDKIVLEIPRLEIQQGEFLALLGPNGAGKTTLLRVMGLLHPPDTGKIFFKGMEAGSGNTLAIRRRITHVFQEPLLLNDTVFRNAALGLKLRGVNRSEVEKRLRPWLERLGIGHLSARAARTLSGGEAQRTSLARALAVEPELLLLDEPFGALDPATRESLRRDFHRVVKETGVTTVFVTHDREDAYVLADRIGVLKQGRMLQLGSRDDVFHRPASSAMAEIVGVENRLAGFVAASDDRRMEISIGAVRLCAKGPFPFPPGAAVVACIRAQDVRLAGTGCDVKMANRFKGRITEVSPGMDRHRVSWDCGAFQLVALIDRRTLPDFDLRTGVECAALFDVTAVHVAAKDGDV